MKGYKPQVDWGGEGGAATIMVGGHNVKLGTSGWRKRCLFILLVSLLMISLLNLLLTLYMLRKIGIHTEGAGAVSVINKGVKVNGISRLDHKVEASDIRSRPSNELVLSAFENMTMTTRAKSEDGVDAGFILDSDGLAAYSKKFTSRDDRGQPLFTAAEDGNEVAAKFFTVTGDGGAYFEESVQTERLLASDVQEFQIESKTRAVTGRAGDFLRVEARDGDVNATSFEDLSLSAGKKIRFESPNVFLYDLLKTDEDATAENFTTSRPESQVQSPRQTEEKVQKIEVFQLCVCPSGRLFLASAKSVCTPDENTC